MRKSSAGGAIGTMVGGVGKVLGKAWPTMKSMWPMAIPLGYQGYQMYGDYNRRSQMADEQAKTPPRKGFGNIAGAGSIVDARSNLMPKFGGDTNMSSTQILDSFIERSRAYEWGAEQFCKAAGFDDEDTKVMMEFLKEAAPRFAPMRLRGGPAYQRIRGAGGVVSGGGGEPISSIPGRGDPLSPIERSVLESERAIGRGASGRQPNILGTAGARLSPGVQPPLARVTPVESIEEALRQKHVSPQKANLGNIDSADAKAFADAAKAGKSPAASAVETPKPKAAPAPVPAETVQPTPATAAAAGTTPGGATPVAPMDEAIRSSGTPITPKTHKRLQEAFETTMGRRTGRTPGGGSRSVARYRASQGGGGAPPATPAATEGTATEGGGTPAPELAAAGAEGKPDRSWMLGAGLLGGAYLGHGYGTEGGTFSMFDPPEVRKAKQDARNKSLGIGQPAVAANANNPNFGNDFEARDRTAGETFLKMLRDKGPTNASAVASNLYGGVGQPATLADLMYYQDKNPAFAQGLRKQFDPEMAAKVLDQLHGRNPAGSPGGV